MNYILIKKLKPSIYLFLFAGFFTLQAQKIDIRDAINTGQQISKNKIKPDKLDPEWIQIASFSISLPDDVRFRKNISSGFDGKSKPAFDMFYSINYPLFQKLTIGAVAGFQYHFEGHIFAAKLGATLRYFFKNYEGTNLYFLTAKSLNVDGKVNNRSGLGNARIGLDMLIAEKDDFNLLFLAFWDNDSYSLNNIQVYNQTVNEVTFHGGYGIGIGIRF